MLTLKSDETVRVPGRGTIKILDTDAAMQAQIRRAMNDKAVVRIDGEGFYIVGIECFSGAFGPLPRWGLQVKTAAGPEALHPMVALVTAAPPLPRPSLTAELATTFERVIGSAAAPPSDFDESVRRAVRAWLMHWSGEDEERVRSVIEINTIPETRALAERMGGRSQLLAASS